MNKGIDIRLELGIDAQRFMQQVIVHNDKIESLISEGINKAMEDVVDSTQFVEMVREKTKEGIFDVINRAVLSWDVKVKIQKAVEEKLGKKIDEYADQLADQIISNLPNQSK
jgi:hypothetical protein